MEVMKNKQNFGHKFKKAMTVRKVLILSVVALLLVVVGSYIYGIQPVTSTSESVSYTVSEGDTMNETISELAAQSYIRSEFITKLSATVFNYKTVYPGTYTIDLSWNSTKILEYLSNQENVSNETTLTLLPNDSARAMAEKIADVTNLTSEEIINTWNDSVYLNELMRDYSLLTNDILNDQLIVKLEGYLYPDTYRFHMTTTVDEVTRTILNNAQMKYETIAQEIANSKYSVHEIYSLASIIEWEASSQEDRNLVSSVFHNRLDIGMRLESSVTICYAIGEFDDWRQCETNPDVDSPYNTRLVDGLPVGPILNPTLSSLEAALNPTESDYYYFLADPTTGNVYFSRTYEEHQFYYEKYLADQMEGD